MRVCTVHIILHNTAQTPPVQLPGTHFHQTFTTLLTRVHSEKDSRVYFHDHVT